MAIQFRESTRNAMLDAIESNVGVSAVMKIFTGAQPANCAAANTGTLLATLNLPSDWMAAASAGAKGLAGSWTDSSADGTGVAAHYRMYLSDGTTCFMQGSVGEGSGDLSLDNTDIAAGQAVTVNSFTINAPNA